VTELTLRDLRRCFDGRIPAVIATVNSQGVPNITYMSAVHPVDEQRVALSNQFMSKTARNLVEQPAATLLLLDPVSYSEYLLHLRYERTDRRGPVFERLRDEVARVAALTGMQDVFRLRSADICRVESIELVKDLDVSDPGEPRARAMLLSASGELAARMSRCADLETLMTCALAGLDELLGYRHSSVMLLDESGGRLFTIASRGFPTEGVGSEVALGDGAAGVAAERCEPVRIGQLRQMRKYSRTVRRSFERDGVVGPGRDVPLPALDDVESRLAVPAMVRGELVGVVVVESPLPVAFDEDDEAVLTVVASLIAQMIDHERATAASAEPDVAPIGAGAALRHGEPPAPAAETHVRFFAEDGSVFLDGDYLIRGVAGRILWSLVQRHVQAGQTAFTNKELRLDKSLELPGFRDNLDTRLVMLKRRLDERDAPLRIERTGRGTFDLRCCSTLRLESHS
jgi:predicted pyridoxine 5'-phosphate oxidase superfamily flavin-nucleotide-binding protein